jgi:hypothetical protein
MSYFMFIDDERFPPNDNNPWIVCRTLSEVKNCIAEHGYPIHISFDHDLGEHEPTGMDIAHFLVTTDMDAAWMTSEFTFYVHSQNPIGAANIQGLIDAYVRHRTSD